MTKKNKPAVRNENNGSQHQVAVQQEFFSGPIPHPQILERYEHLAPGAANRIISMAEKQENHRHKLETKVVSADTLKSVLGSIFGLIAVIGSLTAGSLTALHGAPIFGGGISLGGLAILGAAFFIGRKKDNEDNKK